MASTAGDLGQQRGNRDQQRGNHGADGWGNAALGGAAFLVLFATVFPGSLHLIERLLWLEDPSAATEDRLDAGLAMVLLGLPISVALVFGLWSLFLWKVLGRHQLRIGRAIGVQLAGMLVLIAAGATFWVGFDHGWVGWVGWWVCLFAALLASPTLATRLALRAGSAVAASPPPPVTPVITIKGLPTGVAGAVLHAAFAIAIIPLPVILVYVLFSLSSMGAASGTAPWFGVYVVLLGSSLYALVLWVWAKHWARAYPQFVGNRWLAIAIQAVLATVSAVLFLAHGPPHWPYQQGTVIFFLLVAPWIATLAATRRVSVPGEGLDA